MLDIKPNDEPVQSGFNDYDSDGRRERIGNNRYHTPKAVTRKRRKQVKASRKRNRSK